MGDYLRIARSYLHATPVVVWCFLFFCLLGVATTNVEELTRNQGGMLAGVLSKKSYLAMFVYFNACLLGVLLRDHIAQPWANLVPRYRQKHLLVTAGLALIFLALPTAAMAFGVASGIVPASVGVLFLSCLAAGLWTLHHPLMGFLPVPFLVFVAIPASFSPGLAAFLAGASPSVSMVLACISLLAIGAFAWRLLALNEGMLEYTMARVWGDLLRGRAPSLSAHAIADGHSASPADSEAIRANAPATPSVFSFLNQIEALTISGERTLWQRVRLWRLGTSPTPVYFSLGHLLLTTPFFILLFVMAGLSAKDTVVIFSVQVMTNPFVIWPGWFLHRHRLGYESMRPRTREEFVQEVGLAIFWDMTQCWLAGLLMMAFAAAIWAPELLQPGTLTLFVIGTAAGQLCAYAIGIWSLKYGAVAGVSCAFGAFMAVEFWMLFAMQGGFEVPLAIASMLALASLAMIALAYRRWCLADLD